jgi:hypothetical protein
LQAQYGPTETCPIGDEFYAMRHRRWRHADYTLQLWVDSLPELHGVTVEAEVGDQPCDAFVGIPFAS